jgi:hypothetical protein
LAPKVGGHLENKPKRRRNLEFIYSHPNLQLSTPKVGGQRGKKKKKNQIFLPSLASNF